MPKPVRMMKLSAPKAGQKPVSNKNMNGALTGKKPAPYKKFKPEAAEADAAAAPPAAARQETPFAVWLRAVVAKLAENELALPEYKREASEYVLAGAPYRGDSHWESKDRLKELGARFHRNLSKKEGCEDKSIKKGWWAAEDDAVLFRLLNLDRDDKGRHQWWPLHMGHIQTQCIYFWIRDFRKETGVVADSDEEMTPDEDAPYRAAKRHRERLRKEVVVPDWISNAADGKHLTPRIPEPTCGVCSRKVLDQFLDCECPGAQWTRCPTCTAIYRPDVPPPHDKCKC